MADPNEFDDVMPEPSHREAPETLKEGLGQRFVSSLIIYIMIQVANSIIGLVTLVQFIFLLVNDRKPNPRLASFGEDLGIWVAKALRYQAAASETKPWPWTELD